MTSGSGGSGIRGWKTRPLTTQTPEPTGRLTLDFSGTLLPLPDDVPVPPPSTQGDPRPLGHDAWAADHVRRSTPPPMQRTPGWLEQGLSRATRASSLPPPPTSAVAGSAFDLVDSAPTSVSGIDLHREMADRFALGDFSGALGVAELILGTRGKDPAAEKFAASCREKLEQFYVSRLGSMASMVRVAVSGGDVRWLGLDHRAAFLISRIDGSTTVEDVVDTSGMPRLEALRTLAGLLDQRAIELVAQDGRAKR